MSLNSISRRAFLWGVAGFCAALPAGCKGMADGGGVAASGLAAGCRVRLPNPYTESGKPIVAVVRGTEFKSMLAKGMELLGGFARFGSDKPVIIKPNFVWARPYPTSTDGASVLAVIELLRREGFSDVTVAEFVTKRTGLGGVGESFDFYGFNEKAGAGGFRIDPLADDEVAEVRDGRWIAMQRVGVFRRIYEAPLIIDMPTLKEHNFSKFTCALKNMMGAVDQQSCADMHSQNDRSVARETRLQHGRLAIAEIAQAVNPDLTIMDARTVIGKTHAVFAGGIPREANRVIISGDPLAADRVAAGVLAECYDPFEVAVTDDTFSHAARIGLGTALLDNIAIKEATA